MSNQDKSRVLKHAQKQTRTVYSEVSFIFCSVLNAYFFYPAEIQIKVHHYTSDVGSYRTVVVG
jgi:hypothetical protein